MLRVESYIVYFKLLTNKETHLLPFFQDTIPHPSRGKSLVEFVPISPKSIDNKEGMAVLASCRELVFSPMLKIL